MFLDSPVAKSFWMPIATAVAACGVFLPLGWSIGLVMGAQQPDVYGFLLGTLAGAAMWFFDHIGWMMIVNRYFTRPAVVEREEVEEEDPLADKMRVDYSDGTTLFIKPPCTDMQLYMFAARVMLRNVAPIYENFTGTDPMGVPRPFSTTEFANFREWLVERRYARNVSNNQIELTEDGKVLMVEIANGALAGGRAYSPTARE